VIFYCIKSHPTHRAQMQKARAEKQKQTDMAKSG